LPAMVAEFVTRQVVIAQRWRPRRPHRPFRLFLLAATFRSRSGSSPASAGLVAT
jgi:hypothetical protein